METMEVIVRKGVTIPKEPKVPETFDMGMKIQKTYELLFAAEDLREGQGNPAKYIVDNIELRKREEGFINIHPIQPGG